MKRHKKGASSGRETGVTAVWRREVQQVGQKQHDESRVKGTECIRMNLGQNDKKDLNTSGKGRLGG